MKSPAKTFSLLASAIVLLTVSCASHRHAGGPPPDSFYCHVCHEYHPFYHEHYRIYYNDHYYYHRNHPSGPEVSVTPPSVPVPPPPPLPGSSRDPLRKLFP